MKCPHCGADNSELAQWCYLCEHPFTPRTPAEGPGTAPGVPLSQAYPQAGEPQGYPPSQVRAYPTPAPGDVHAYPPPAPGTYPPAYGVSPPQRLSGTAKILLGILAVLAIIVIAGTALFVVFHNSPTITMPTPPGFREASDKEVEAIKSGVEESSQETEIDFAFISESGFSAVVGAHLDALLSDMPPSGDLEAAREYYEDNKSEIMRQFNFGLRTAGGMEGNLKLYEVEELKCGEVALHMELGLDIEGFQMAVDLFIISKSSTAFLVTVQGMGSSNPRGTLDFVTENLNFK